MQLEELIYSCNDDFKISKAIKEEIKNYLSKVTVEGGKDFFVKHTKKMDYFISLIYKYILKKDFLEFRPSLNNIPITILALGSYGREQLSIYSDIDIMIVYKEVKGFNLREIIENFITMLWDLGLKIGHRVHEISDLFKASNEEITIKTAMLESRFIIGSKFLWFHIENELEKIRNYEKREYILAKYEEMKNRHKKYPISMEPNIKEGFGGIRDSNTLLWITKALFNYPNTSYLVPKYATMEEFKEYRSSLEFIFKVRVYLHLVAKKKRDVVYLQYQRDIALKLGYEDSPRLKAERKFIKDLLKAMWSVNTFCEINIKRLIKPLLYSHSITELREKRERGIYFCDKAYTTFKNRLTFKEIIKILKDKEFEKADISIIANLKSKKENLSKKDIKELFFSPSLYPIFFALYRANKLEKIVPPFEKVKYLAQFDGYHHYPVDIHSLYTLKELSSFEEFNQLNEKEKALLRFTAFFHDLGKGRAEEHAIVGAKLAKEFAESIKFHSPDTISKLIKYHTLMSDISQREDIYNDKVILSFAKIVENREFLTYLYILTLADIKAVGENILTSFKRNLLETLYFNTLNALENRELISEIASRTNKEKRVVKNEEFLKLPRIFQKKFLKSPSNQLFLQNSTQKIIEIAKAVFETEEFNIKIENERNLIIEIIKKDSLNLSLGWLLEKLENLKLNHLSIYKIANYKYFKIEFEENIEEFDKDIIKNYIIKALNEKLEIKKPVKFKKGDFNLDCNHSQNYASLKIKTKDRAGIIATIMNMFDRFDISVEDVKITSVKNIARDLFIIPKETKICEKYPKILEGLTE